MITATFATDFSKWQEGLKNAQTSLKSFELSTVGIKQQLQRMVSGFDGSKIIRDAQVAVAAIDKIGGVAKLTANEQKRLSATVDEALAKYRALGEEAPKDLLAIEHELKNVSAAQKDISAGVDKKAMESLKGLNDGAKESTGAMSLLGSTMKLAFGGAVLGGILAAGKSVLDFGGHLTDLSQQTGIATDDLQTLGVVGRKAGLSMDDLASAVTQMSKRLAGGDASAVGAVQSLGLKVSELVNLAPDKAFERIAAAVGEIENPMLRTKIATELLGKAGAQALPIMTSELGKLRDAAKESGEVIDTETVAAMDDLGDSWEDMKTIGAVLLANVMRPMIPVLHAIAEGAKSASAAFSKDLADQSDFLADAWKRLVVAAKDIPGALTNLQAIGFTGQSFDAAAAGANAAAAATTNFAAAQKGSISATDLANNRLKALRSEAVAPLTAEQKTLIVELDKFGESNKDIADSVGSNAIAVKLYLDVVKKLGEEAKEAAKKQKELTDQLSGKEAVEGLRRLMAAWNATPESIRRTTAAQDLFLDQWDKLGPTLTHVPAELAGVVKSFNAMSMAAGKFSVVKVAAGLKSLDGIATDVHDALWPVYLDLLKFESDVSKIKIGDIIASAFKLDDRIETNFMNTVTDLQQRLTLVNKKGLDRQLAELQFSKAKELATIKANSQLTEEEYRKLASIVEGIYGKMANDAIKAASFSGKFVAGLKQGLQGLGTDLVGIISGVLTGDLKGDEIGKALGASIGGAIGFAFGGPFGAAVGAAVGQGIAEIFSTKAEQTARKVARDFGTHISEEMGQAIVDRAKELFGGDQVAAQIFSLGDIIKAAGGLNFENVEQIGARLHDVFSEVETGAFSAAQGMEVLDDAFKAYADFVTKDGALASAQLLEIIRLNDEFGTHSAAVADFVSAQASKAAEGFNKIGKNFLTLVTGFKSGSEDMKLLLEGIDKAVGGIGSKGPREAPEAHIGSEERARNAQSSKAGFAPEFLNDVAEGLKKIAPIAEASFGALLAGGASFTEALAQMAPGLEQIQKALTATGQQASGFLGQILGWEKVVGANKELFEVLDGVGQSLEGLHNSGRLTQDAFASLAAITKDSIETLERQGVTAADAFALAAPELQTIWELQKDFHFEVDDATQALLDQAEAAGVVGNEHRSVQEQMLAATKLMSDAVLLLAEHFGVDLPADMQTAADAAHDRAGDIQGDLDGIDPTIHVKYDVPQLHVPTPAGVTIPTHYGSPTGSPPPSYTGGNGGSYGPPPQYRETGGKVTSLAAYKASKISQYLAAGGSVHKAVGALAASALLATAMPAQAATGQTHATPAALYAATGTFVAQGTDTVPAMLTPGEYVLSTSVVQKQGLPALEALRSGQATVVPSEPAGSSEHRRAATQYASGGTAEPLRALARADGGPVPGYGSGPLPDRLYLAAGGAAQTARATIAATRHGDTTIAVASALYAASGSFVPKGTDTVPAMLTPGEYVLPTKVVQKEGVPALEALREGHATIVTYHAETKAAMPTSRTGDGGSVAGYASGGVVTPSLSSGQTDLISPTTHGLGDLEQALSGVGHAIDVMPHLRTDEEIAAAEEAVRKLAASLGIIPNLLGESSDWLGDVSSRIDEMPHLLTEEEAAAAQAAIEKLFKDLGSPVIDDALRPPTKEWETFVDDMGQVWTVVGGVVGTIKGNLNDVGDLLGGLSSKVPDIAVDVSADGLTEITRDIKDVPDEKSFQLLASAIGLSDITSDVASVPAEKAFELLASSKGLPPIVSDIKALPTDKAFELLASSQGLPAITGGIAAIPAERSFELLASSLGLPQIVSDIHAIPEQRAFQVLASANGLREITQDVQAIPTKRDFHVLASALGLQDIVAQIDRIPTRRDMLVLVQASGIAETLAALDTIPTRRDVLVPVTAVGIPEVLAALETIPVRRDVTVPVTATGVEDVLHLLETIPRVIPLVMTLPPVDTVAADANADVDAILAALARLPSRITIDIGTGSGVPGTPPPGSVTPPRLPPELHGSPGHPPVPTPYPIPSIGSGGSGGGSFHFAQGGLVPAFYAAAGRYIPRGTDTVLAGLTPGEGVLNTRAMAVVGAPLLNQWNRQPESLSRLIETSTRLDSTSGTASVAPLLAPTPVSVALPAQATGAGTQSANSARPLHVNFHISALDGADVTRVLKSSETRNALRSLIVSMLAHNESEFRTDVREKAGIV